MDDFDYFCGEIRPFAFAYAPANPEDWIVCDGQTVPVNQYALLYSVIGNTYGGQASSTIGLPDFRGRAAFAAGTPDTSAIEEFGATGAEGVKVGTAAGFPTSKVFQLPAHRHVVNTSALNAPYAGAQAVPSSSTWLSRPMYANRAEGVYSVSPAFASNPASTISNTVMIGSACGSGGQAQPHENRQPYLVLNFCIAVYGQFPQPAAAAAK